MSFWKAPFHRRESRAEHEQVSLLLRGIHARPGNADAITSSGHYLRKGSLAVIHWNEAIPHSQRRGLRELLAILLWFVRPSDTHFTPAARQ